MYLVIFDIDGTLTNTEQIDEDCFVRALAVEFGIFEINTNWTEYTYTTDSGITQQIFIEKLGRVPLDEELARVKRCFVSLLQEASIDNQDLFSEIPGSGNALAELLLNPDLCVAIATGGWGESAKLKLQKANLEITGIPFASANDALSREDIVNTAIIKAKDVYQVEKFDKIVFVGDGIWDVKAAHNLSIAFIGVGSPKLISAGATQLIKDFTNLEVFREILQIAEKPDFL
ncbi:MAG: HAD family hydrolase [Nostoc sp. EkiNYC01]|nr:HAD hydrolase-like protein [Nostoc sp. EkiNYC01]